MTPVERVAEAIMIARGGCNVTDWREAERNEHVAHALRDARAAIEAMREPTEAMLKVAVDDTLNGVGISGFLNWPDRERHRYQLMIDAALEEPAQSKD